MWKRDDGSYLHPSSYGRRRVRDKEGEKRVLQYHMQKIIVPGRRRKNSSRSTTDETLLSLSLSSKEKTEENHM